MLKQVTETVDDAQESCLISQTKVCAAFLSRHARIVREVRHQRGGARSKSECRDLSNTRKPKILTTTQYKVHKSRALQGL
jgi:hypothetical protein